MTSIPMRTSLGRLQMAALVCAVWLIAAGATVFGGGCHFAQVFHVPCPGCGMTRALGSFAAGRFRESLTLQPLAVPALVAQVAFAAYTVAFTWRSGSPLGLWRPRAGQFVLAGLALVGVACVGLWLARFAGAFGGPVPV